MADRRKLRRIAVPALLAVCFLGAARHGEEGPDAGDDTPPLLVAAREVVGAARYAALITLDESGSPQARTMDPFPPEPDWTIWLATDRGTRKVGQLGRDPRATLYYWDSTATAYVTLIGRAALVDDPSVKARLWKKEWEDFYPGGSEGERYLLIRFEPQRLEMVSVQHSIAAEPDSWEPAIFQFHPAAN